VAALPREAAAIAKGWERESLASHGRTWPVWRRGEAAVIAVGTGYERAFLGTNVLIESLRPEVVTSIGFAGSVDPSLRAGDLFLPDEVIWPKDGSRLAVAGGSGTLVTCEEVAGAGQKQALRERFSAQAVDMEAAAVGAAARRAGVGFRVAKAISDEAGDEMEFLAPFTEADGFRLWGFLGYVALRPWLWSAVRRLARNSRRAEVTLAGEVARFLHDAGAGA
jgi:adenosylhomocysteine nucleosidase